MISFLLFIMFNVQDDIIKNLKIMDMKSDEVMNYESCKYQLGSGEKNIQVLVMM